VPVQTKKVHAHTGTPSVHSDSDASHHIRRTVKPEWNRTIGASMSAAGKVHMPWVTERLVLITVLGRSSRLTGYAGTQDGEGPSILIAKLCYS
jgi:hypothetical protein